MRRKKGSRSNADIIHSKLEPDSADRTGQNRRFSGMCSEAGWLMARR